MDSTGQKICFAFQAFHWHPRIGFWRNFWNSIYFELKSPQHAVYVNKEKFIWIFLFNFFSRRPSFKYYSPWMSLVGSFLCVAVMFLMDWKTALLTFVIVGVLYMYISYRKPEANWGSSTQAQQFVTTLKNCHTLNEMPEHVKNYRLDTLLS